MKNKSIVLVTTFVSLYSFYTGCKGSSSKSTGSDTSAVESTMSAESIDRAQTLASIDELAKDPAVKEASNEYLFDPKELQKIVKRFMNLPLEEALPAIHKELMVRYPGKFLDKYRFIFNDAGAALGQVAILYASKNEYVIFFGSPIATGGFSGRYAEADFYDIMIAGEMKTVIEGELKAHTYGPGDLAVLPRGVAKGYSIDKSGWMLEYSRGNMMKSFNFGVNGPANYITMDWVSAKAQIADFMRAVKQSSSNK